MLNYTINQAVQSGKASSSFNLMEICIETFSVFCLLESVRTGFFSWLSKVGKKKPLNLHLIFIKVLDDDTAQVAWFII